MKTLPVRLAAVLLVSAFSGCGPSGGDGTCDPIEPDCPTGEVCEIIVGGEPRCLPPIEIRGQVLAIVDDSPIDGALVQAVDVNGAAIGTSGATDADGRFELTVPAVRDEDGVPVEGSYTLRVQAAGFQEFPTPIRPALPLDASTAVEDDGEWVIENALTTVKLIALPGDTSQLGSISGSILADRDAGILVVAEGAAGTFVGFSDSDGNYTIFNVVSGGYVVQGYAAGVQLDSANATLAAGEEVSDVDLDEVVRPLNTVSGNVQIVNAPGGSITSVVLALESTFDEKTARGTVPPGLRVGNVTGTFTITNVPDGQYVVLAAFENDNLVRDPDENIGGTQIVHITVPDPVAGNVVAISEGFKVTEALAVISPGTDEPEEVTTLTPTFTWADDSSEDGYVIQVFDAFGTELWSDELGPTTGGATVSDEYAGPALEPGMFYQFKVRSFRDHNDGRTSISTTEDLRGVFYYLGT